ncbi:MAG: hypothetical protein IJJ33_20775 [Victivallales bacterium]|nr:hypothetical protein [Victivallales bacterium]
MNSMKKLIAILIVLLVVAGLFLASRSDPLKEMKTEQVENISNPRLTEFVDKALELIQKEDLKSLYKMMASRDWVMLDVEYKEGLFKEKDFCPAEILDTLKIERGKQSFYKVHVKSARRGKTYTFTVLEDKGRFRLESISEKK